jgi:hypothetical protein
MRVNVEESRDNPLPGRVDNVGASSIIEFIRRNCGNVSGGDSDVADG